MVSHRIINNNTLAPIMFSESSESSQGFHLLLHIKHTHIVSCHLMDHTESTKITPKFYSSGDLHGTAAHNKQIISAKMFLIYPLEIFSLP